MNIYKSICLSRSYIYEPWRTNFLWFLKNPVSVATENYISKLTTSKEKSCLLKYCIHNKIPRIFR